MRQVIRHFERTLKRGAGATASGDANGDGDAETGEVCAQVLPHEICVIGDRLLTDIVFANIYGMRGVLVPPLSASFWEDHPVAAVVRKVEIHVLLPIADYFYNTSSRV